MIDEDTAHLSIRIRPAVPQLADEGPLVATPILGACAGEPLARAHLALLAHTVKLIVADRPGQVQAIVGNGARWGLKIELIEVNVEPTPAEAAARYRPAGETGWLPAPCRRRALILSQATALPLFESYASWFAALLAWMPQAVTPARVRAVSSPSRHLGRTARPNFADGQVNRPLDRRPVFVEPRAIEQAGAIVEDRAVVERDTCVTQSWIGADAHVGQMTSVAHSLAAGSMLTNWLKRIPRSKCRIRFSLCSLARPKPASHERPGRPLGGPLRAAGPAPAGSPLNWITARRDRQVCPVAKLPASAADQPLMKIASLGHCLTISEIPELTAVNSASFRDEVRVGMLESPAVIEIDLSETRFVDSSGTGALFALYRAWAPVRWLFGCSIRGRRFSSCSN